jgi:hypothetical protein
MYSRLRFWVILLSVVGPSAWCLGASPSSVAFVKNEGQWDFRAKYLASMNGGDVWLTNEGYVLDLHQPQNGGAKGQVVRVSFSNGDASPVYEDGQELPGKLNYFIGNQPSKWTTNVPRFAGTTARNVGSGLDVRYYFDGAAPRYDLIVAPGADPSSIAMNFEGADGLQVLPNGNLQIATSLGPVEERGLVAYQQQGMLRVPVPCQMSLVGNAVHFKLADYDKSKPLVIDPLLFCTYWTVPTNSQSGDAWLCSDSQANLITVGTTIAQNLPTTPGAYQTSPVAFNGAYVGYISKLSADGTKLLFGTYLSGSGINAGNGAQPDAVGAATTDASGNIYLAGSAGSHDFPTTGGAYQPAKGGPGDPNPNAFVTELSADGSRLIFSTFFGGAKFQHPSQFQSPGDGAGGIALDSVGNVIITGVCTTLDFPTTAGSYDSVRNLNQPSEGFIAKFNPTGSSLLFSTLLTGGTPNELAVDSANNIFLGGSIDARFFKSTTSPFNIANATGFLGKLSGDGSKMLFAIDMGPVLSLAVTPTGVAFVAGAPSSTADYPSAYDLPGTYHFPSVVGEEICLGQFSPDGSKLLHGAVMQSSLSHLRADQAGNLYLFDIEDIGLPTTVDAYQQTQGVAYLAELSPEQDRLLYGSYFGPATSSGRPSGGSFVRAGINRFFLVGGTNGEVMPVTPGAYNTTNANFYAALVSLPIYTHVELTPNPVVGGLSVSGKVTIPSQATGSGSVITLTSSDTGVKVPSSVTIPAGSLSQTFTVTTTGVAKSTASTISAKFGVGVGTAQLVRTQAALLSLSANPGALIAGQSSTATVPPKRIGRPRRRSSSVVEFKRKPDRARLRCD